MLFRGLTILKSPKLIIKGGLCYGFAMVGRMKVRQYRLVTQKLLSWYFVTLYIWGQHSFDTSSWLHFIFTGETPVKLEVNVIEAPSTATALVCLLTPSP